MSVPSLFTPAMAQSSAGGAAFDPMQFLPLVVIFAVFYFLFLRPQQKRQKQKAEMLKALRRGDKVLTSSGLFATVDRLVSDQEVLLELAPGVVVRAVRETIADVVTKPQAAEADAKPAAPANVVPMTKAAEKSASSSKAAKPSSAKKTTSKPTKPKK